MSALYKAAIIAGKAKFLKKRIPAFWYEMQGPAVKMC
jgi:hypothetical protein